MQKILTLPVYWTDDMDKADKSPYPYGPGCDQPRGYGWYLSTLSILHRWTGLTLETKDD